MRLPHYFFISVCLLALASNGYAKQERFTGYWSGNRDGLALHQKGDKICGFYWYEASTHEYTGRLTGTVKDNILKFGAACGRPGGRTSKNCPDPSLENEKSYEDEFGWSEADESAILCKGKVFVFQNNNFPRNCQEVPTKTLALGMKKFSRRLQFFGKETSERSWLKQCLGVANSADEPVATRRSSRR